jgi:hypothetical protein
MCSFFSFVGRSIKGGFEFHDLRLVSPNLLILCGLQYVLGIREGNWSDFAIAESHPTVADASFLTRWR